MTAINVIRHMDADTVYMLTDGLVYNDQREIVGNCAKVWPLPHLNAVVAVSGIGFLGSLLQLPMSNARSFDHLKLITQGLIAAVERDYEYVLERYYKNQRTRVVVAGISEANGPDSFIATNYPLDGIDRPDFEPCSGGWLLFDTGGIAATPGHPALLTEFKKVCPHVNDSDDCDPVRDGLKLLQVQRELRSEGVLVGGHAQLVTVTREGVSMRIIHRWPDDVPEIGEAAHANAA